MNRKEKTILSLSIVNAVVLGAFAIMGTVYCALAATLLVPALIPVVGFATYKLSKLSLAKKNNIR